MCADNQLVMISEVNLSMDVGERPVYVAKITV